MNPKKRIGEMLMEAGIIDETQLKAALGHQRQWGVRLGQALVDLKLATEADIVGALSVKFGFGVAELSSLEPYGLEQALKLLPREFAIRNNVFPMAADTSTITVAMSDPTNLAVVDEIRFRTGRRVKVCIGGDREVAAALQLHYPSSDAAVEAIALDLDADDAAEAEAVFDPFGGGSKDALEAFFSSSPDPAAEPDAPSATAAPAPEPAPPAAATPRPPAPARTSAAQPAPRPAPAARPTPSPAVPAPIATAPAARPAAPAVRPPAPAPAPRAAEAPPSPTPRRKLDLELEELTPGPGGFVAGRAAETVATAAEATGTAEFTLTEEVTGSGLLIPDDGATAPTRAAPPAATLTARELEVLHALERLAGGAHAEPEILKPAQAMAALALLLVKKGIVGEQELLAALTRR